MGRAKEFLGFEPAHSPHHGIVAYARWLESVAGGSGGRVSA